MTSNRFFFILAMAITFAAAGPAVAQDPAEPPPPEPGHEGPRESRAEPDAPQIIEVEVEEGQEYEIEYQVPEAPPYEITTPPYHDPHYDQPPRHHRPRRVRVPYQAGMEIPPGGQIIKRRKLGLAIPGAVLFAVPFFSTLAVWNSDPTFSTRDRLPGYVNVPVFGPFVALREDGVGVGLRAGLAWSGIMQLAGVTMMSFGFIGKKYLVYYADVSDRTLAFQFAPIATRGGGGAALGVSF